MLQQRVEKEPERDCGQQGVPHEVLSELDWVFRDFDNHVDLSRDRHSENGKTSDPADLISFEKLAVLLQGDQMRLFLKHFLTEIVSCATGHEFA